MGARAAHRVALGGGRLPGRRGGFEGNHETTARQHAGLPTAGRAFLQDGRCVIGAQVSVA